MKYFIRRLFWCLLFLLLAVSAGYIMLVASHCIPVKYMQKNMYSSYDLIEKEGMYHGLSWNENSILDNYTDAAMLVMSSTETGKNIWLSALCNYTRVIGDLNPNEVLIAIYHYNYSDYDMYAYTRYWEGYMVILKPLLCFFDYPSLRKIVFICQIILVSICIFLCGKVDNKLLFSILGLWLFLNPFVTTKSLQFNTITSITFIMIIIVLFIYWKKNQIDMKIWDVIFLLTGCATSYFDLLTFPLLTWGAPLALWVYLYYENTIKENILHEIEISFFWGMGYLGMWASKWVLGKAFTGIDVVDDASNEIARWTVSSYNRWVIYYWTIFKNISASIQISVIIYLITIMILMLRLSKRYKFNGKFFANYLLLFIAPFIWYFITIGHAVQHYWFTYRNMGVCVISLNLVYFKMEEIFKNNSEVDFLYDE